MVSTSAAKHAAILARVRKCLALAKSANEHEAAAALGKARELMDEYGLEEGDVVFDEATARGNGCIASPPQWECVLLTAVKRAIQCDVHLSEGEWRFVGRAPAAELAAYAFTVMHRQLKRARGEYIRVQLKRVRPGRKSKRADAFCEGWASTVARKMRALHPVQQPDQTLLDHVAKKFQLVPVNSRNAGAGLDTRTRSNDYWNGVSTGHDTALHRPVGGSEAALQLR